MKEQDYGDKFQDHLIEQYKTYVEMTDRISSRRDQSNRFYISLLSGLLVLLSIVVNISTLGDILKLVFQVVAFVGIVLCILWWFNIRSYRQLNKCKFQIIHEMEEHLPFPTYRKEWEILKKSKYLRLTRIEQYVPVILAVLYLILLIFI